MKENELDRDPGYLYEKMADHLEKRIRNRELEPYSKFPDENSLARCYGVSLGTSRQAMRLLQRRGLVVIVPCKGTYVAKNLPEYGVEPSQ